MDDAMKALARSLDLVFLVAVFLVPGRALAQNVAQPRDIPEEVSLRSAAFDLLKQERYAEADKRLNDVQREYEVGKRSDESLLHVFRVFYDTAPALQRKYDAWVAAFPRSYAARMARGIYRRERGAKARGRRYIEKTSPQAIATLEAHLQAATPDFEASFSLTAKPILTYHAIVTVARYSGDAATTARMFKKARRIDPRNFIVRYMCLATQQTRWGGSLAAMLASREEARKAGLTRAQLAYFDDLIRAEREWLAEQ
jgi:hypothetical protein